MAPSCEDEVLEQLLELQRRAAEYAKRDGRIAEDELFYAEQNARLARNAEEYYRTMVRGRVSSWNLRDRHMAETLAELVEHLDRTRGGRASADAAPAPTKVVVWAHNSHLGDARATELGEHGELNLGQLVREEYGADAVLVGFTTYAGTVTAASDWDEPAERKRMRPALGGSCEALFHEAAVPDFLVLLERGGAAAEALQEPRLERAIGVVYRPETERASHYFHARVAEQFDAVIHLDRTRAVEPLDPAELWRTGDEAAIEEGEPPETYPTGI